jgi:hypothetical protein
VSLVWEDAWETLNEQFCRVAEFLSAGHPTLSWSCGHSDNEAFPFRAWASFNGGGTGTPDVVISFDVLRKGGELQYSTDIALEAGPVLADGPTGVMTMTSDLAALRVQIENVMRTAVAFVDDSRDLLAEQLSQRPP